ncbi:hypothetical protein Nepgr_014835 [Nepenthes gracilis]|uniref:Uncharacterized protein n=1 Tax=Nepenthes gracilis TaxID=150966 RepID=A0AAD3SLU7_NEPGR|nr:hypothetical protein Nepgr_014835 [Nepenthes gracilis]
MVLHHRIKDCCIWTIKVPDSAPWSRKKLMKLRVTLRTKIRHHIGNGGDTFLWFDSWHPLGLLHDRFNKRIRCITGLPLDAKVKEIIRNGD